MKLDKKKVDMILKLNDDALWQVLSMAVSHSGSDIMKKMERPKDMSKIRSTLSSLTDEDIARVQQILKSGGNREK